MVKIFCDNCGGEITDHEKQGRRCIFTKGKCQIEVMEAFDGCCNKGNYCAGCIRTIASEGELTYEDWGSRH